MTPEGINATKEVIIEAIKILGPAGIAAWVGYIAGKAQIELRLKELKKQHEFEARKTLFEYYKEKTTKIHEIHSSIHTYLEELMGYSAASPAEMEEISSVIMKSAEFYVKTLPKYIETTKNEMREKGFLETPEYSTLEKVELDVSSIKESWDHNNLINNLSELELIYNHLSICNQLISEKLSEEMLDPYIKS